MLKSCPLSGPLCKEDCTFMRNGQCEIVTIGESLELLVEGLSDAVKYLAILAEEAGKPVIFEDKEPKKAWKAPK